MPAPATVDEFVDLVRKSAVLDEPRLSEYVYRLKSDPTAPKDPSGVAGLFVRDGLLTYFQAEQVLQGKWKRFNIGKYKVLERLGSGGMGQVFLCEHKLMRRRVAVKVLPTAKAQDPSSLERFYREARAVAALDHPNIVRAYDIDQDETGGSALHFLVMEYVDGASLQEMVKKTGPMDPTRACHYIYWSAVGLQHAHANGLIHRDIKPGNILVDRQGVVKILDLGLARFFNDDQDLLTKKYDESVLGTADYLAPEQAVDSHAVDGRADMYSLGATFYFLLTGQPPFAEGTVAQKLLWHQTRHPKPVRDLRPQVPEGVGRILEKMMAKRPEDRYPTPEALADALLPFVQTPISTPPDEEMPRLSAAAQANTSGTVPVLSGPRPIPSGPRTPAPAPRGPSTIAAAPRGGNGVAVADADTQKARPAPVVEPLPVPESAPGVQIWAAISAETANSARADTDRTKRDGRSSRKYKAKPPEPKSALKKGEGPKSGRRKDRPRPAVLILALVVGAILLVAAGAAVYWFALRDKGPPKKAAAPSEPRTLVLTKAVTDPTTQFPSLKLAFAAFRPGDAIVIQDDEWEETVTLPGVKDLVLRAADGKRVTWRAPAGKGAPYLLQLHNWDGARISGIRFDCAGKADVAVWMAGPCPGLVLEDVDLVDATTAGLELHDCTGDKGRAVVIRRAHIVDSGVKEKAGRAASPAAVLFASRGGKGAASQEVQITDCTVDGPTPEAPFRGPFPDGAFVFDGAATGVAIRGCRVKAADGIVFRRRPDPNWRVELVGNFFQTTGAGLKIEDVEPLKRKECPVHIHLAQNHFLGPGPVSFIEQDPAGQTCLHAEGNVRKSGVAEATGWAPKDGQPPVLVPTTETKEAPKSP